MATILTAVQSVAEELGLEKPASLVGNTGATARRFLRAANAAGRHLRTRDWRALTFEHTFTTSSGTLEYALPASPAFHHLKPGTAFDRTLFREMVGPHTPALWQYTEALLTVSGGLEQRFRIKADGTATPRADKFYLLDDPGGSYTLAYEYVTHEWAYDGSSTYRESIAADTDQPVFGEYLFECELRWRVLRALGEAYFDEKDEAVRLADRLYAQENGETIPMRQRRFIAPNIPEGSWS
ncbi:MAG: phage adaptor protein [Gammaproteobacteria bacterium]